MKERPILMSSPMVRAILEGNKTQTRRAMKNPPSVMGFRLWLGRQWERLSGGGRVLDMINCPYGEVGDRLWVKETHAIYQTVNYIVHSAGRAFSEISDGLCAYRADGFETIADFKEHVRLISGYDLEAAEVKGDRWQPSIFMPRWASRILLEITDIRVERLQDISEADAIAEGIEIAIVAGSIGYRDYANDNSWFFGRTKAIDSYRSLWESINGKGSWDINPWVWCISFRRIK